jgi:hypothetical protein
MFIHKALTLCHDYHILFSENNHQNKTLAPGDKRKFANSCWLFQISKTFDTTLMLDEEFTYAFLRGRGLQVVYFLLNT